MQARDTANNGTVSTAFSYAIAVLKKQASELRRLYTDTTQGREVAVNGNGRETRSSKKSASDEGTSADVSVSDELGACDQALENSLDDEPESDHEHDGGDCGDGGDEYDEEVDDEHDGENDDVVEDVDQVERDDGEHMDDSDYEYETLRHIDEPIEMDFPSYGKPVDLTDAAIMQELKTKWFE